MRKDASDFAKDRHFNGYLDNRSGQENFDSITFFIQESVEKQISSKTRRSISSVTLIPPKTRRKIRKRNRTHAKAEKTGRSNFKSFRQETKADVRNQDDLYANNLVSDIEVNPRDFFLYI